MAVPWRLRDGWLRLPSVEKKLGLFVGFTTRRLGDMKKPRPFARALARAGLNPLRWAGGEQVHGKRVRWVSAPSRNPRGSPGTDGVATGLPGLALRAHTADCAPVFLADGADGAVALVHAGWRGAAKGIVARAVRLLAAKAGTKPQDLSAFIGPCIQACCYEVGPEVAKAIGDRGALRKTSSQKYFLNLPRALMAAAARAGVPARRMFAAPHCTLCDRRFFSFRRDKTTKRCAAVLVRRNLAMKKRRKIFVKRPAHRAV